MGILSASAIIIPLFVPLPFDLEAAARLARVSAQETKDFDGNVTDTESD